MGRNDYAWRLAQRSAMNQEEKARWAHHWIRITFANVAIKLSENFNFTPQQIDELRSGMTEGLGEYEDLMNEVDIDYANGVLLRRYKQIMEVDEDATDFEAD